MYGLRSVENLHGICTGTRTGMRDYVHSVRDQPGAALLRSLVCWCEWERVPLMRDRRGAYIVMSSDGAYYIFGDIFAELGCESSTDCAFRRHMPWHTRRGTAFLAAGVRVRSPVAGTAALNRSGCAPWCN